MFRSFPSRNFLVSWALVVSMWAVAMSTYAASEHRRVVALEQQLAAYAKPAPAAGRSASSRTWTASNGVTFSGADLDRLSDEVRKSKERAAEIEYVWTH